MMNNIFNELNKGRFRVIVSPNKTKNCVKGYDSYKKAIKIDICQPAREDKANKELVKFFKKEYGIRVALVSGGINREKILEVIK